MKQSFCLSFLFPFSCWLWLESQGLAISHKQEVHLRCLLGFNRSNGISLSNRHTYLWLVRLLTDKVIELSFLTGFHALFLTQIMLKLSNRELAYRETLQQVMNAAYPQMVGPSRTYLNDLPFRLSWVHTSITKWEVKIVLYLRQGLSSKLTPFKIYVKVSMLG